MLNLNFMREELSFSSARSLHRFVIILITTLALFSSVSIFCTPSFGLDAAEQRNEKAIALVNGSPIFPSDLSCAVEASLARRPSFRMGPTPDGPGTLNRLIDIELLYQESLKHRFPGLVEETEELFEREIRIAGGVEKLRSTLMCNSISLEKFRKSIFRNTSINRLLNQEVYSRIIVNEKEIEEHFHQNVSRLKKPESVRLRQIFIRAPLSTDEDSLKELENRARSIFKKATEGDDFVLLARKYSDDPKGTGVAGEMGVIFKGNLHKTFESLIFSLREGSVTEPVRSSNGYHIFQVVSFSPASPRPLEEVRSRIITLIRLSKARSMICAYVSSLKAKADIRIFDKEILNGGEHEPAGRIRQ